MNSQLTWMVKQVTPVNDHLFNIDKGSKTDELKAEAFHAFTAKALFLAMRSRPDIRLTVAFPCTRVQEPTTCDWMKLVRMMNFLKATKTHCLTLKSNSRRKIEWSADAASGAHADMKWFDHEHGKRSYLLNLSKTKAQQHQKFCGSRTRCGR